jgi:hypothetical protein
MPSAVAISLSSASSSPTFAVPFRFIFVADLFSRGRLRIHLRGEVEQRLTADFGADFPPQQQPDLVRELVGGGERAPARKRQRTLEQPLDRCGEDVAAANLCDFHDLHQQRRDRVGVLRFVQPAAEHEHHGSECELRDVAHDIEVDAAAGFGRGDAELGPQSRAREAQAFDDRPVRGVEKHDLPGRWRDHHAGRIDQAVRGPCKVVEGGNRGQRFEKKTERDVDARHSTCFFGALEQIGKPAAGDEFRDDDEVTGVAVALYRPGPCKPLVVERREQLDALPDRGFEGGELGPQEQPFEHDARFAIEGEQAPPQAVDESRRRGRRVRQVGQWRRHLLEQKRVCNPRTRPSDPCRVR